MVRCHDTQHNDFKNNCVAQQYPKILDYPEKVAWCVQRSLFISRVKQTTLLILRRGGKSDAYTCQLKQVFIRYILKISQLAIGQNKLVRFYSFFSDAQTRLRP